MADGIPDWDTTPADKCVSQPSSFHIQFSKLGHVIVPVSRTTLKELIANGIVERKSYDEVPPRVEYTLTERGKTVVPILQSICHWAGIFYKEDPDMKMAHCQKCDYKRKSDIHGN